MAINDTPTQPTVQPTSVIPDAHSIDPAIAKYSAALATDPKSVATPTSASAKAATTSTTPGIDDYSKALNSGDPVSDIFNGQIGTQDPRNYNFNMKPGLDNDLLRAQDQGWLKQTGIALANIVPNIATGIGESMGQLGTLMQFGDDRTYSNALTQTMQQWHNPFGEVYSEHPGQVADLGDSAWWINNASSLIEMTGQFAALGGGIGGTLEKGALGIADLVGAGEGSAMAKALLGGAQVATSGAISYTIGAQMGAQVYQKAYTNNYNRLVASGVAMGTAATQAKHIASQAAATTVQLNTALGFGLNLTSVLPVFKQADDVLDFFQKDGEGARAAGESLEDYKSRLQSYSQDSRELNHVTGKQGIGEKLIEGGKQAAEMSLMHFSQQAGNRLGDEGKTEGFLDQFGQLSHVLDDVTSSQGIMNAVLGVVGGVLNTAVLEKIPLHSDYVRQNGEPVPVMNQDGTPQVDSDGNPLYQTKLYNSREMATNQRMAYFESTRDAIVADIDHIAATKDKLTLLASQGKTEEMQSTLNDLLAVQQLHSIALGTGDNMIAEYKNISATDNHTDLGVEMTKQAEGIASQQGEILQDAGVQSSDQLPPDQKAQFDDLDKQRKDTLAQATKLTGVSDAMQKGYTTSMKDDSYKERAEQASQDILTYQKWHQDLGRMFGGDPRNIEAHVPEIVLHKQIQSNLYSRLITKLDTENSSERLAMTAQAGPVLSTDNFNSIVQDYNRKVVQNSRVGNSFNDDIKLLQKAVSGKDQTATEALLNKYKIDYPTGDIGTGVRNLLGKLTDLRDTKWQQSETAHKNLGESLEFQNWQTLHPDSTLADYIKELNKRTLQNESLSQKEEYTEQLRGEHQILNDQITKIKSKPKEYAKSVLQDYDRAQAKLNDRVKAENNTFVDKDREQAASDKITANQKRAALKVYQTKVEDIEAQIAQKEQALTDMQGKTTSKLGKMIAWVRDPLEKSTRQEISNLQAQRDFFRDKIQSVILPSDTPEETSSEGELTAIPEHIANLVTAQAGQISSQLTPDQIRSQIRKVLQNEGIDYNSITGESIDALTVRALSANKDGSEKDNDETLNSLDDLISATGNPELVREAIDEILNEQKPFSYDALQMHQIMGFVDQPTAAKIMQHVSELMNGSAVTTDKNTITPSPPVPTPVVVEGDTPPSPLPEPPTDTPDPEDTDLPEPDAPTPDPDGPSDLPTSGRNVQKNGKPTFHQGAKAVDAIKINRLDIAYKDDVNQQGDFNLKSSTSIINRNLSDQLLQHGLVKVGDKVTLSVDKEWNGKKNVDTVPNTQTEDSSDLYFDKNGQIPIAQNIMDEVPIKVVINGKTEGYLPRVGWVLAQYEGAENYRNIASVTDESGAVVSDAQTQAERLRAVRANIVKHFNSGSKDIETTIEERGPAHLIMNVDKNGTLDPQSATKMLPDTKLELGVVDHGLVKIGKSSVSEKELNLTGNDAQWMNQGSPVATVPMPDGKFGIAPLLNRGIEPYETKTMLELIRTYMAGDQKVIDKVKALTGFDISRSEELRNLINQHYTYTNRFAKSTLQSSMDPDATPRFMFNITNETGHQKAEISIGTAYSGRDKVSASLIQDGTLHPEFIRQFTEGMAGRFKNVVFEDNQRNLKGVNSDGPLNEIVFSGNQIKLRKAHASYNDYVKSFSDTPVNGTNTLSTGEHVYGVHSNTTLDMGDIISSRPDVTSERVPNPADIEVPREIQPMDPTTVYEGKKKQLQDKLYDLYDQQQDNQYTGMSNEGIRDQIDSTKQQIADLEKHPGAPTKPTFSQEDADLLNDGFMDMMPNFNPPGLTLESLRDLHTFTPESEHNGKSPSEVMVELKKLGLEHLPPNFNPFLKC